MRDNPFDGEGFKIDSPEAKEMIMKVMINKHNNPDEDFNLLEEEERQQTYCTSCNKITNSSREDYQSEFTCNDCGVEVQEEE